MKTRDYIQAKLEDMHTDIHLLKTQVDELRQDMAGRRAINKVILGGLASLGGFVTWLANTVINLPHN